MLRRILLLCGTGLLCLAGVGSVQAQGLPDLTISGDPQAMTFGVDQPKVILSANVWNIGLADAEGVSVVFEASSDNGASFKALGGAQRVPLLPAGSGVSLFKDARFLPGCYVVRVLVDPRDKIVESSEKNNWAEKAFCKP